MFLYGDCAQVISGFYRGLIGVLLSVESEEGYTKKYLIYIPTENIEVIVKETEIKKIKKDKLLGEQFTKYLKKIKENH